MTAALTLLGISLQTMKSEADVKVITLLEIKIKGHVPERRKTPRYSLDELAENVIN